MSVFRSIARIARIALCALLLGTSSFCALAQPFPSRPLRLVLTFPPGGATDVLARVLTPAMSADLGQPIVIDNRPGASGMIGTQAVAREKPDGHTLLFGTDSIFTVNPHLYADAGYDPFRDFVPVAPLTDLALFLAVHPSVRAHDLAQLIALAKAEPGRLSFASPGIATPQHLSGELFAQAAGIQWVHVPYKGGAPAVNDLLAGQVPAMFGNLANFRTHVTSGKLRLLGVADPQRFPGLPEVPAIAELLPGFAVSGWFALFAPAGTPTEIVARLEAVTAKALRAPEVSQRLETLAFRPLNLDRVQFASRIRSDFERNGALIRARGIRAD